MAQIDQINIALPYPFAHVQKYDFCFCFRNDIHRFLYFMFSVSWLNFVDLGYFKSPWLPHLSIFFCCIYVYEIMLLKYFIFKFYHYRIINILWHQIFCITVFVLKNVFLLEIIYMYSFEIFICIGCCRSLRYEGDHNYSIYVTCHFEINLSFRNLEEHVLFWTCFLSLLKVLCFEIICIESIWHRFALYG